MCIYEKWPEVLNLVAVYSWWATTETHTNRIDISFGLCSCSLAQLISPSNTNSFLNSTTNFKGVKYACYLFIAFYSIFAKKFCIYACLSHNSRWEHQNRKCVCVKVFVVRCDKWTIASILNEIFGYFCFDRWGVYYMCTCVSMKGWGRYIFITLRFDTIILQNKTHTYTHRH